VPLFLLRCQVKKSDNEVRYQIHNFVERISPKKITKTKKKEEETQAFSLANL
jgi:hypothetical protein